MPPKPPSSLAFNTRRVVVTGLGLVTPLGTGVSTAWNRLIQGASGVVSVANKVHEETGASYKEIPSLVAGLVPKGSGEGEFDAAKWVPKADNSKTTPFMHYAYSASQQALEDANWFPSSEADKLRTGVCIGSGIGCVDEVANSAITFASKGFRKIGPFFVPRILTNMAAGNISIRYGFMGPNHSVSTACATGAHSIGDAMRFIQYGDADVMLAGGTEASVSPLSMAGFARSKSLSTKFNDRPTEASRPFDKDRDGFVIGEGAGMVVLEEYEHAKRRGAKIYAELRGYGLTGDAHHITSPPDDGNGAARAMRRALEVGRLPLDQIDYINAHATGTELGDLVETRAIKSVFTGSLQDKIAVSSTKGAIGHLLGAAGSVEAIFTILAIHEDMLPPTLNLHAVESKEEFSLNYVPLTASSRKDAGGVRGALTNSFVFGGTNASLCFAKVDL
ncbi:hypothetical protein HDU76_005974 [Blyttiomyces sp. JEL0837]|nr:hypothetical protein HDU76_005974 [Blyttiomyces sp. JEL0837]